MNFVWIRTVQRIISILLVFCFLVSLEPAFGQQSTSQPFTSPYTISNASSDSITPQVIVSKDGIFVTWAGTSLGRSDIFFSKSSDNGSSFGKPLDLSGSTTGQSGYPELVQQDKDVYVVWQSSHNGNSDILLAKSTDGGTSFESPIKTSETSSNSTTPKIAISGNHVYLTWIENSKNGSTNIVFSQSADGGASFAFPLQITTKSGTS
jgi:hypothetical protein